MAKTFLRSGNLDAVLALGENGQPVYASALQIRETLRLRRQSALTDCLAIPQANDRGDRLDWYAPFSGRVKSWLGASDHERRAALQHLTACQQDMQDLSTRARAAENPSMRLFGALLSKTLQFPDQQYVYLVDGKPVITFWGFVDAQARSRDDALACLRDTLEENLPVALVEPPPAVLPAAPVVAEPEILAPPPVPEPEILPEPEPQPAAPVDAQPVAPLPARRRFRVWYLLPPVAIAAAVMMAVLLHRQPSESTPVATAKPAATPATVPAPATPAVTASQPPVAAAPTEAASAPAVTTPATLTPPAVTATAEARPDTQPQSAASTTETPPAAASATLASEATPTVPAKPDDLIVTPDAVRDGQVQVIDGRWRVTINQMPTPTGKPPVMRFQFKNGKGSVQVTQGNTSCKADVSAAMTSAGNLVIESRYTAKCQNNSRYRMPLLVCHASIGAAQCEAQFAEDRVFPMTIKRESK
ncbi:SrfA family protein [Pantoea anthophila]|uniref:SrfA family protein n=1 Tax=Pantoea anthophila TaxID=470931 RepID=UPI002DBC20B2|nr:SrfA family protein [Pantoea anthophila]MEB5704503.1 SrfA family protein [Pantoea anthophila]MEB6515376.1 SrfA family protein [Pantoea anthophila]